MRATGDQKLSKQNKIWQVIAWRQGGTGYASLGSGKCGILITNWCSNGQHDSVQKEPASHQRLERSAEICVKAVEWVRD